MFKLEKVLHFCYYSNALNHYFLCLLEMQNYNLKNIICFIWALRDHLSLRSKQNFKIQSKHANRKQYNANDNYNCFLLAKC